jgi:hypothetical protein
MSCSSCGSQSPLAQFLKSQSPQELMKAKIDPQDALRRRYLDPAQDLFATSDQSTPEKSPLAGKADGTGIRLDITV